MQKKTIDILGMHCNGCVRGVTFALNTLPGMKTAVVSLEENAAHVEFDEAVTTDNDIRKAIIEAGYDIASVE